jgi:class 3 adenylate cyclase
MGQDAKLEYRLAAIMATDVVGYSQSMQSDEAGTLAALGAIREATQNQISHHRGRIANTAGDSVLLEFASVVEAVGDLDDGAALTDFSPNLTAWLLRAWVKGCSVNQKSRLIARYASKPTRPSDRHNQHPSSRFGIP